MSEHTKRGLSHDRAKAARGQKHEAAYETKKTVTTSGEGHAAAEKVGRWRSIAELMAKRAGEWADTWPVCHGELKRDAAYAARDYRKPGRRWPTVGFGFVWHGRSPEPP